MKYNYISILIPNRPLVIAVKPNDPVQLTATDINKLSLFHLNSIHVGLNTI
jgi:hypothetical protein